MARRFGVSVLRDSIVLEYAVPKLNLLAHHNIRVVWEDSDTTSSDHTGGLDPIDVALAEKLQEAHGRWLNGVLPAQLVRLVARLREAKGTKAAGAPHRGDATAEGKEAAGYKSRPRRPRAAAPKVLARARRRPPPKPEDVRSIFDDIDREGNGCLSEDDFYSYFADQLGFGQADVGRFFSGHCSDHASLGRCITFDDFLGDLAELTPSTIEKVKEGLIIRKPGAFAKASVSLAELEHCEVYICTPSEQVFVDQCKGCHIMLGPCASSIFTRDCEDCTFWIAAQQLRTRSCTDCTYYLYSKTDPIIEASEGLAFAPWCASYPHCADHFASVKFDPQRNHWNALYDFTGKKDKANWRILCLDEVEPLSVELDEAPDLAAEPDNPVPEVSHELLCAKPLCSEDAGQSIANIPQCRPEEPRAPSGPLRAPRRVFDEVRAARPG